MALKTKHLKSSNTKGSSGNEERIDKGINGMLICRARNHACAIGILDQYSGPLVLWRCALCVCGGDVHCPPRS